MVPGHRHGCSRRREECGARRGAGGKGGKEAQQQQRLAAAADTGEAVSRARFSKPIHSESGVPPEMRAALCLALLLALLGGSLGDVDGEAPRVASRSLLAGKAPPPKKTEASRVDKWRHAMGVLTRVKNKEIAQRTTANGDTKGTRDCYENDEHFSMALEGSWRTKTDDTSLWVGLFFSVCKCKHSLPFCSLARGVAAGDTRSPSLP